MKKDNKMKSENKKGFPGILVLFIIGLITVLAFQNFSASRTAEVAFSHQLEHLVNLDLVEPKENKKISLNDNLVTFSGVFREQPTEASRDRYRYLNLLDQNHTLLAQKNKIVGALDAQKQQVYNASLYFLQVAGVQIPERGFVVVPDAIVITDTKADESLITLPGMKKLYAYAKERSYPDVLARLKSDTLILLQEFRKAGIGNEQMKRILKETETLVEQGSIMDVFDRASRNLDLIVNELVTEKQGVRLYDLRAVRSYLEESEKATAIQNDYDKNMAQLDKARSKVASNLWFFNNHEISTSALEAKNPEEYHQWFSGTEKEWKAFNSNKGLAFKAPDQPRSLVLEKTFKSEEQAPNYFSYLFTFLPIILVALLLYFIFSRQMKGVGSSAMNFGKSPAKMLNKGSQRITFDDVAGINEAKEELEEIVDFLREPTKYSKLGARIPKGVLLIGPPGTGKTLIAKAVAGEAGVPFFSISGSDFVEMFVGVGASRVRDLFDQARKHAPCIIFIDEIDAVGRHRGSGLGGGHDEREQTLNQLLVEIDGMESAEGVIILAATNRPDVLDTALLRPGRFDRSVYVDLPDYVGRLAILKVHTRNVKLAEDVDLKEIARRTPGASGADLQNIVNESALLAARKHRAAVTQADIRYAQEKVQLGKERKSLTLDEEDKRTTAWHEAGHALLGLYLNTPDKVSKVTSIPRGRSLGATHFEQKKNRVNYKKKELLDQLVVAMGGRVAEEMINHDASSGAQMDIKQATSIARAMVCEWGMSEKIGMINYGEDNQRNLMAGFHEREFSEETALQIDQEIKRLLDEAYNKAKEILTEKQDILKLIAESVLEFETLEREDLDNIMAGTWNPEEKRAKMNEFTASTQKSPPPISPKMRKTFKKKRGDNPQPNLG